MDKKIIRLLKADEIECRIGNISEKGISILLYKDARVDQKILDEVFGPFGWKRSHASIDGNLYCTVSVRDPETGEWISKQDVGTTGFTEKEKSQASDSFKRACFNWGIGRELYSAPFIWLSADKVNLQQKNGKYQCYDRFTVTSIGYNDANEICSLSIVNDNNGKTVYTLQNRNNGKQETAQTQAGTNKPSNSSKQSQSNSRAGKKSEIGISQSQIASFQSELDRTGVTMAAVEQRYKVSTPEEMSPALYEKVMHALSVTPNAKAA